jgi:hypothetical protein
MKVLLDIESNFETKLNILTLFGKLVQKGVYKAFRCLYLVLYKREVRINVIVLKQLVSYCLFQNSLLQNLEVKMDTFLSYSMEQNPYWEANRFSASQEIPRILWNPKVYCRL